MNININFKDKTIVVGEFGCVCDEIKKYEDDWISLHIVDDIATLYSVGHYKILEEYDFIDSWVLFNQKEYNKYQNSLEDQTRSNEINLSNMVENENMAIVWEKEYAIEQEKLQKEIAQAEEVNKVIISRIAANEGGD